MRALLPLPELVDEAIDGHLTFAAIPLSYTVEQFCDSTGLSRSGAYKAIEEGALQARKHGHRTLILHADAMAFLESLPHYSKETKTEPAANRIRRHKKRKDSQPAWTPENGIRKT